MSAANSRSTVEQAPSAKEHGRKRPGARQNRPQELRSTEEQKNHQHGRVGPESEGARQKRDATRAFLFSRSVVTWRHAKPGFQSLNLECGSRPRDSESLSTIAGVVGFSKGFYAIARRKKQTFRRNVVSCGLIPSPSNASFFYPWRALSWPNKGKRQRHMLTLRVSPQDCPATMRRGEREASRPGGANREGGAGGGGEQHRA